ncbi:MAG: UDP-N-acetylmuramoyl-L-alanine--D-glutamate ligase [Oscillospiraceae bacterium]|nr:UDP-N-acetylmuramoyl-L-alanine--D-glutamate ligase [Oscillospiraceae bacterium]
MALWGMETLAGRRVLVAGMVRSGIAASKLLLRQGARPILNDLKPRAELKGLEVFDGEKDIEWALGVDADGYLDRIDLAVISPGVPIGAEWIKRAKARGIPVIAELELGAAFANGPQAAITGTNGKTTTTALLGEMLRNAGRTAHAAGNIGDPISGAAIEGRPGDTYVIEVSSFQLEATVDFHPSAGALLNITPDHLNRHGDMRTYIGLKRHMFENMTANDTAVVNADDETACKALEGLPMKIMRFSMRGDAGIGAFIRNGEVTLKTEAGERALCETGEVRIPGGHNLQNAMAAACLACVMGAPAPVIRHTLRTFAGVEHRIETVRALDGVTYINDSKGTNVDSTLAAIAAMGKPTVIILGGYDKHVSFAELAKAAKASEWIREAVLIGDTAAQIKEALEREGFDRITETGRDFEKCVEEARRLAKSGWNVLFSPACASFDMFHDYEHRGHEFRRLVEALA